VSHLEGGTEDRKLVCDRPFAPLLPSAVRRGHQAPFVHCWVEQSNTSIRRRFSLSQEDLGRVIPGGEGPGDGMSDREKYFSANFVFHL